MVGDHSIRKEYENRLGEFVRRAELDGAMILTGDGFPVASVFLKKVLPEERISALIAAAVATVERVMVEVDGNPPNYILVKGKETNLVASILVDEMVLLALAPEETKIGLIYSEMERTKRQLEGLKF